MGERLLKHAQLTKQFQLEMKVVDLATNLTVFHLKAGFLPQVAKFALFHLKESGWHAFAGAREITNQTNMNDEDSYTLRIILHIPGDADRFVSEALEEFKTGTGPELKAYLYKILKEWILYCTIEYEK
uniref:Uncharacterized protein n=1 Tax=Pithovirus LCPAC304 TaxID=2506594 RepID=A0A481ZA29_9VIRU|nr:MAG: hypothetical protein LCPAC304_05690 [Pithovirus LCPAC304]